MVERTAHNGLTKVRFLTGAPNFKNRLITEILMSNNPYGLTDAQMNRVYDGYAVNIKQGWCYVNDHGDVEFCMTDSLVDENVKFDEDYA